MLIRIIEISHNAKSLMAEKINDFASKSTEELPNSILIKEEFERK